MLNPLSLLNLTRNTLPPEARKEADTISTTFHVMAFLLIAVVGVLAGIGWLLERAPALGMIVAMVLAGFLIAGAINGVRRSRQRHLAYETMLRTGRSQVRDSD
jgi:F0F1-type ATP synthase assembly protein I